MRILNWIFGKKDKDVTEDIEERGPITAENHACAEASDMPERSKSKLSYEELMADNLRRWTEAGQAWAWVQRQGGQWDHDAWLGLLEELKRSSFWPMQPDALGLALEKTQREWLSRN